MQKRDGTVCRPFTAIVLLVEFELERYDCTVIQVNGVSISVAGSEVAGGHNELPTCRTCTVQERASHESERATLWSRSAGRSTVNRRESEAGDYGAGDCGSFGIADPELYWNRRRCSFRKLCAAVCRNWREDLVTWTVGARPHRRVNHGFHACVDEVDCVIG